MAHGSFSFSFSIGIENMSFLWGHSQCVAPVSRLKRRCSFDGVSGVETPLPPTPVRLGTDATQRRFDCRSFLSRRQWFPPKFLLMSQWVSSVVFLAADGVVRAASRPCCRVPRAKMAAGRQAWQSDKPQTWWLSGDSSPTVRRRRVEFCAAERARNRRCR